MKIRFYDSLEDLVSRRKYPRGLIDYPLKRRASIKDIIESLGVPHTEVGKIVVNRDAIGFSFLPNDKDFVKVYPLHPPVDVRVPSVLRPETLPGFRFVVDVNVGKLAPLLRMIGYDAYADFSLSDAALADLVLKEKRILLSRDKGLLKRRQILYGYLLKQSDPEKQLCEVVLMFGLQVPDTVFPRCMRCNKELVTVDKETILHLLQPLTRKYYSSFYRCPGCQQIYWPGSHAENMMEKLKSIRRNIKQSSGNQN